MIVRVATKLDVIFGRIDEDGEVVNQTSLSFPLGKLCAAEWERVLAEVEAKQAEIQQAVQALLAAQAEAAESEATEETRELDALSDSEPIEGVKEGDDAGL